MEKHIINSYEDENVGLYKGREVNFFNFYSIRRGNYISEGGVIDIKTNGYGVNFGGMIKFVSYIRHERYWREMKLLKYYNRQYLLLWVS